MTQLLPKNFFRGADLKAEEEKIDSKSLFLLRKMA